VLFDREFTRLLADHIQGIVKRAEAEYQESMRKVTCPNCGTPYAYDVCQPSKPLVFTPLSFTGILMGGIANAMADRIFPEVNVCRRCGHRWPAEY
jgi:DNA-directed RNA polymerase subunit M/transcription elongation factor TFIIS